MFQLGLITLCGAIMIVLLDAAGANAARRLGISYGWMLPISLAFYAALGVWITALASVGHATGVAALVALADVTAGTEVAYRAGVVQWPTGRPTPSQWLGVGLTAILLMTMTAFLAGLMITPGAW